jgi:hypothetical protein
MEINGMHAVVINGVVALLCLAIYRTFPSMPRSGFFGYYLVLMPAGFAVWESPAYWLQAVSAVLGLGWITFVVARSRKQVPQAAEE